MKKNYQKELEEAMADAKFTDDQKENEKSSEEVIDAENSYDQNEDTQTKIISLKEEISDLTDKLLRNAADAENMRKRYEKQIEEAKIYAISNFAKDMLLVMDNLSRALSHQPQEMSEDVKNIIMGVDMTKQEMKNIFTKYKMNEISPSIGDKFDYNLHSAVAQVATKDHPEGTILSVMQVGYSIDGRLLRPAMVTVSKQE